MQSFFGFLAAVTGFYSTLIFVRIILSWFSVSFAGRFLDMLTRVTDPFLDWWKNRFNLRIGYLDFSVVIAIASLSALQSIFRMLSLEETITIGNILAVVLLSLWSIVSFIAVFCLVVIILRVIAYFTNRDIYSRFWGAVDSISRPILYRFNRLIFGNQTGDFLTGIIFGGRLIVILLVSTLRTMPL